MQIQKAHCLMKKDRCSKKIKETMDDIENADMYIQNQFTIEAKMPLKGDC